LIPHSPEKPPLHHGAGGFPGFYFGGAGVKISRRCPGSGFGFGLGAFFASFRPLSFVPMLDRMTQLRERRKGHADEILQYA